MRKNWKRRGAWAVLGFGALFLLAACGAVLQSSIEDPPRGQEPEPAPTATTSSAEESVATATPTYMEAAPEAAPEVEGLSTQDDRPSRLEIATRGWDTNWNLHTVDYDELRSGGPPRDGIPSIDEPKFVSPEEASAWLDGNEPVIALEIGGDARAYPLQILTWHEIVNDVVGDLPVLVTFCPLCNSAITFDRTLDGEVYEFGTSGLLRNSDLVMYDRTTESLWQQFTGEAIVGDLVSERLMFLPSSLVSFADFRQAYPGGIVLSRDTGYSRSYGRNPYAGYDRIDQSPFLFDGELDDRLAAMARVITVSLVDPSLSSGEPPSLSSGEPPSLSSGGTPAGDTVDVAYPLSVLAEVGVINDTQAGRDLAVFYAPGTSSALDTAAIAEGADVGATGVFEAVLDGQKLTFRAEGLLSESFAIVDEETGSTWNVLGQAVDGPLAGERLTPIVHGDHFWFAWAAFKPDTIVYQP